MTDSQTTDWLFRGYDPVLDDGLPYLLGISYCRSRAGQRAGASRAGRDGSVERATADHVASQKAFLEAHRPIWQWLLANADVRLAVDPEVPHIIAAWLITSGPDVIHAAGCKRALNEPGVEPGPGADVIRQMLGDRLERHQVVTLELPQLAVRKGTDFVGLERPKMWSLDCTWLLTRMLPRTP